MNRKEFKRPPKELTAAEWQEIKRRRKFLIAERVDGKKVAINKNSIISVFEDAVIDENRNIICEGTRIEVNGLNFLVKTEFEQIISEVQGIRTDDVFFIKQEGEIKQ